MNKSLQRAEKRAVAIATLELKSEMRAACAGVRERFAKDSVSEEDCISVLTKIPGVGKELAFYMIAHGVGHIHSRETNEPLQSRFERIIRATEPTINATPQVGPLKAKIIYNALDFARFDLMAEMVRDGLNQVAFKGEVKEYAFETLRHLSHLIRTGKHPEDD